MIFIKNNILQAVAQLKISIHNTQMHVPQIVIYRHIKG